MIYVHGVEVCHIIFKSKYNVNVTFEIWFKFALCRYLSSLKHLGRLRKKLNSHHWRTLCLAHELELKSEIQMEMEKTGKGNMISRTRNHDQRNTPGRIEFMIHSNPMSLNTMYLKINWALWARQWFYINLDTYANHGFCHYS